MRVLLAPTLVRRVCLSLLVAFALAYVVLLGYQFWEELRKDEDPAVLSIVASHVASQLVDVSDVHVAATVGRSVDRVFNGSRQTANPRGPLIIQIWRHGDGVRAYSSPEGASIVLGESPHLSVQDIDGTAYRVVSLRTPLWSIRTALQPLDKAWAAAQLNRDLWPYVLLAFPFVLVPMWLAVQRGMRPLTELSARIADRSPGELSPLGVIPRHREMAPLVRSLDSLMERLRGTVEAERDFVNDAAHELRTPMAVIAANAHLVVRADNGPQRAEAAAALASAVDRASHLVGQLLELARLDRQGAQAVEDEDLARTLRTLMAQVAHVTESRGIEMSLEGPDSLHCRVDCQAFVSVLANLLDNALRYGRDQGRIEVTLARRSDRVQVSVADDGKGIPPAERERVFDRFFRGSGSKETSGSGLGLAIALSAAGRLDGTLTLSDGINGRGCRFTCDFPFRPPVASPDRHPWQGPGGSTDAAAAA